MLEECLSLPFFGMHVCLCYFAEALGETTEFLINLWGVVTLGRFILLFEFSFVKNNRILLDWNPPFGGSVCIPLVLVHLFLMKA